MKTVSSMRALALLLIAPALAACAPQRSIQTSPQQSPRPPNILLIVADDLGYSDLGVYGGEIRTPNLDALARRGTLYTDFIAAPTCSTTRSMLLSGVDNHLNGLGGLDESGRPLAGAEEGYEGYLNFRVTTIASALQAAGYHTSMAGKWHLGSVDGTRPESRGFARSLVLPGGAAAHYGNRGATSGNPVATYLEDGVRVTLPEDAYSSTIFTDKLIGSIDEALDRRQPFFAYAAYTAPHWPLQAPAEYIRRYKGVYDAGYDAVRDARLRRMTEAGLIQRGDTAASVPGPVTRDWQSLDAKTRAREARRMEVYAAMIEALDAEIGRLLAHLEARRALENTLIVFLSDNGPEGNDPYQIARNEAWVPTAFRTDTASLGGPDAFASVGPGWAEVSAAPFRLFKGFPAEGGVRVPAFMVGPRVPRGMVERSLVSVLDIFPTALDAAGAEYAQAAGRAVPLLPLQGRSLLALSGNTPDARWLGIELFGRRSIREGQWKLMWIEEPYGAGRWQLFDLSNDPGERNDLSQERPELFRQMIARWDEYASTNGVVLRSYDDLKYGSLNRHYEH